MVDDWKYDPKIEDMTDEDLEQRISAAMEFENPYRIKTIPYAGKVSQTVTYDFAELVARCPMTGYLDFYRSRITFIPGNLLPELKSLKFYYYGFADLPISHEHLAAKIYAEYCEVVKPVVCRLELTAGIRGGIETTIVVGEKEL
ncbi:MAG: preQ(1) synthase [Thermoleophilia bacterium]